MTLELEFTHRRVGDGLQAWFDNLPQALRETGVAALVIDGVLLELGLVPMHLGIPYVHASNSLNYDFSGHTPLFAFDWPHETTPESVRPKQRRCSQLFEILRASVSKRAKSKVSSERLRQSASLSLRKNHLKVRASRFRQDIG
jgi:zeaxanthin glucosyltransferase